MKASNGWPNVRLGDHVELLTGFPFKSQRFTSDPIDTALVKGENVAQGRIKWEISKRWPAADLGEFEQYRLRTGDVVLAMDRPWIEAGLKYAWINPHDPIALLVQRVSRLRGLQTLDQTFLRYVIASPAFTNYIKPIVTGVNVPHISPQQIKDFHFRLPPVAIQKKIAVILSAYDDLIENNTRRIQILERMARALYREWFVNFRFPGHAKVKLVDSPIGTIPEGWSCATVNDFASLKSGFAFKSTTFTDDGSYALVTIKNVHDGIFVSECTSRIAELPPNMPPFCHVSTGDVLLSLTGNIGRTCLVYGKGYLLNQRVAKIVPREASNRAYTYFSFRQSEIQKKLMQIANGVAQQNLSPVETAKMQVVLPSSKVMADFAEICEPITEQMLVLFRKNANLCRTRDLLLPKLISGALCDEKVEIA